MCNMGAGVKQDRCFQRRWGLICFITNIVLRGGGVKALTAHFPHFLICALRFGNDGFFCCCFHVEKNTCSFLQSKHFGNCCDCSDFFKDLDATYHCFLDCREHNETEVSHGAFIPLLSDLIESSRGHLGHQCQCHFRVCFGFILKKNDTGLIFFFKQMFWSEEALTFVIYLLLFLLLPHSPAFSSSGAGQRPEFEWGLSLIVLLSNFIWPWPTVWNTFYIETQHVNTQKHTHILIFW